MTDLTREWHPHGRTRDEDLTLLAAGGETGWWDDRGRPAPWPDDFLDPAAEWATGSVTALSDPVEIGPGNQPF